MRRIGSESEHDTGVAAAVVFAEDRQCPQEMWIGAKYDGGARSSRAQCQLDEWFSLRFSDSGDRFWLNVGIANI